MSDGLLESCANLTQLPGALLLHSLPPVTVPKQSQIWFNLKIRLNLKEFNESVLIVIIFLVFFFFN